MRLRTIRLTLQAGTRTAEDFSSFGFSIEIEEIAPCCAKVSFQRESKRRD